MTTNRIGRCSICGGNVMAHHGAWFGTVPPPPPTCAGCNAVADEGGPTIPMVRPMRRPNGMRDREVADRSATYWHDSKRVAVDPNAR